MSDLIDGIQTIKNDLAWKRIDHATLPRSQAEALVAALEKSQHTLRLIADRGCDNYKDGVMGECYRYGLTGEDVCDPCVASEAIVKVTP